MAGKLTPLQKAYLLGYRRALRRMRKELDVMLAEMKQGRDDEIADLREAINRSERHDTQVKEVALAMAGRDPDARMH